MMIIKQIHFNQAVFCESMDIRLFYFLPLDPGAPTIAARISIGIAGLHLQILQPLAFVWYPCLQYIRHILRGHAGRLHLQISQPFASFLNPCLQYILHLTGLHSCGLHLQRSQPFSSFSKPFLQNILHMRGGQTGSAGGSALHLQIWHPFSSFWNPFSQYIKHIAKLHGLGLKTGRSQWQ